MNRHWSSSPPCGTTGRTGLRPSPITSNSKPWPPSSATCWRPASASCGAAGNWAMEKPSSPMWTPSWTIQRPPQTSGAQPGTTGGPAPAGTDPQAAEPDSNGCRQRGACRGIHPSLGFLQLSEGDATGCQVAVFNQLNQYGGGSDWAYRVPSRRILLWPKKTCSKPARTIEQLQARALCSRRLPRFLGPSGPIGKSAAIHPAPDSTTSRNPVIDSTEE